MGIAYRTDFDLQNIERASGKSMEYRPKDNSTPLVPHVIEPSLGVERLVMAVLTSSYKVDVMNGEPRTVLALPNNLAPILVTVSPLLKNKPELTSLARQVYEQIMDILPGRVNWDDSGNIGKRYRKADEIGVPYSIVVDFDSINNNDVTVRHRDTAEQERVAIDQLTDFLTGRQVK